MKAIALRFHSGAVSGDWDRWIASISRLATSVSSAASSSAHCAPIENAANAARCLSVAHSATSGALMRASSSMSPIRRSSAMALAYVLQGDGEFGVGTVHVVPSTLLDDLHVLVKERDQGARLADVERDGYGAVVARATVGAPGVAATNHRHVVGVRQQHVAHIARQDRRAVAR